MWEKLVREPIRSVPSGSMETPRRASIAVNGDQLRAGPLALPHLHQHVAAAGDDLGLRVLQPERHGFFHAGRLIQGFHIIHGQLPSFSSWISPASLNAR